MTDNIDIFKEAGSVPRVNPSLDTPDYMQEYEAFINTYKFTEVSGEEVGLLVARMSMYYSRYNMKLKDALRDFSIILRDLQMQPDEATGKAMSSAKADTLAAATPQAHRLNEMKAHTANIQESMNALKSLQKGVLTEYAHSG